MFLFAESGNPTPGNKKGRPVRWERSVVVSEAQEQEVGNACLPGRWRSSHSERAQEQVEKKGWIPQCSLLGTATPHPHPRPRKASKLPACLVSAGLNNQALKTILMAVTGHLMFPFIWWKASLLKGAGKVLLIKDPHE